MQTSIASRTAQRTARSRGLSLKVYFGALVILAALGFVAFSSFQSNTIYYYTLREFAAQRAQLAGQTVRVNGPLDQSSIQLDQKNMILRFDLKDGDEVMPVEYRGLVPDTLKSGESVVAEGRLGANGVFQADTILVKCPSKYEQQGTCQEVNK